MSKDKFKLNSIESAIKDIRDGKIVIVVDDKNRENEGDFIAAAEKSRYNLWVTLTYWMILSVLH